MIWIKVTGPVRHDTHVKALLRQAREVGMIGYSKARGAYGLTQVMARAAGVNLSAAVFEGWYRRDELDRLVDRCDRCGQSVRCSGWLTSVRAAPLPDYCRNKTEIEALSVAG